MIFQDSKLLSILIEIGAISDDTSKLIESYRSKWDLDYYDALIQTNVISDEELKSVIANYLSLPVLDSVKTICTSEDCLEMIPFDYAKRWHGIPFGFTNAGNKGVLKVALSDPTSPTLIKEIVDHTQAIVEITVGTRQEIKTAIFNEYPLSQQLPKTIGVSQAHGRGKGS